MSTMIAGTDRYLAEFESLERGAHESPAWLAALRREAMARFAERGFPTTRDEDWRYTNLGPLAATPFHAAGPGAPGDLSAELVDRSAVGPSAWPRLVFVDGRFAPEHSSRQRLPGGARLSSLAEAMTTDGELVERHLARHARWDADVFAALSTAFVQDGAFLHVPVEAAFGAGLARTTLTVRFEGQGGRTSIAGLYVADRRQHVDHHVTVDHAVPRCSSQQLFKGVLDGSARAVFNGRVIVRPDAQKTDANQTNKHLLLSDGVEVDSKPQLEIFADDVKCTHGAAEGQLAPEAIFYLRSRGLDEARARRLLTLGFVREVVERVTVEPIRRHLDRMLETRLGTRPATTEWP